MFSGENRIPPRRIPRSFGGFSLFLQREAARTSPDLATRKPTLHFVQAVLVCLSNGLVLQEPPKGPTVAAPLLLIDSRLCKVLLRLIRVKVGAGFWGGRWTRSDLVLLLLPAQVPDSDEQFVPDFHSENCE